MIVDAGVGTASDVASQAKGAVNVVADQHGDKVTGAVSAATGYVNDKTGGKAEPVNAYEILGRSEITTSLGAAEAAYMRGLTPPELAAIIDHLFTTELAAIVVANGETPGDYLIARCDAQQIPLLTSPQPSPHLVDVFDVDAIYLDYKIGCHELSG